MVSGIYQLVDGSLAHKMRFDSIANNLANINTNAFKKDIISFDKAGAMKETSDIDLSSGSIVHTGNPLDIALEGRGFLKVQTPQGVRYTRNGALMLNNESNLVTGNGDIVLGEGGPITISGSDFIIKVDGQVIVNDTAVGKLAQVNFQQPRQLKKEGASYYRFDGEDTDIIAADQLVVRQKYIETSNVNPTEEMVKMMEAFRAFESAQKAIQSMDEITSKMVNDPGLLQ